MDIAEHRHHELNLKSTDACLYEVVCMRAWHLYAGVWGRSPRPALYPHYRCVPITGLLLPTGTVWMIGALKLLETLVRLQWSALAWHWVAVA